MKTAIVIAGPTASGKSGLALSVAKEFGGWIINADSMQVYGCMRVLTARPSIEDESQAPHRLYGILPPSDICSAARWRDLAAAEINHAWNVGAIPIVVGGTGLYLRALMEGLSPIPAIPQDIRDRTRAMLTEMGNQSFHQMLTQKDPEMAARLDPGNSQRLTRAWEVIEATGRSLAHWQNDPGEGAVQANWLSLVLDPPRPILNDACEGRFRRMIETGAIEEAEAMAALNLSQDCPSTKALGLPSLAEYCQGRISLEDAIQHGIQATRAYAKRQGTWFRHQMPLAKTLKTQFSESLKAEIFSIIRHAPLTSQ